jgi:cytochrome c556
MTQQLYPSKKPCNVCGGPISWDVTMREYLKTKLPLNLDRTVHDRDSCDATKAAIESGTLQEYQPQPQPQSHSPSGNQEAVTRNKAIIEERQREIKQAHEENIQASKQLNESIQELVRTLSLLTEIVRAYVGSGPLK